MAGTVTSPPIPTFRTKAGEDSPSTFFDAKNSPSALTSPPIPALQLKIRPDASPTAHAGATVGLHSPAIGGISTSFDAAIAAAMAAEDAASGSESAGSSGPIKSRLSSKVWKARQQAFTELAALFKSATATTDDVFQEHLADLKRGLADANAAVQDASLDACAAFIECAAIAPTAGEELVGVFVEKCFAGRPAVKKKSAELCVTLTEAGCTTVSAVLVAGFAHKQPKVVDACIQLCFEQRQLFGMKHCVTRDMVKAMIPLFEHKTEAVRTEVMKLAVELHRWLGDDLLKAFKDLRDSQLEELKAKCAASKSAPPPVAQRGIRTEAEAEAEPSVAPVDLDFTQPTQPIAILNRLPKNWADALTKKDEKWQERVRLIDLLLALMPAERPKLVGTAADYGEVVKALKKSLGDSIVVVAAAATKALGQLAEGLEKEFSSYGKALCSTLLDKMNDKDKRLVDASHRALDQIASHCVPISDLVPPPPLTCTQTQAHFKWCLLRSLPCRRHCTLLLRRA